jgi:hypothetical protein
MVNKSITDISMKYLMIIMLLFVLSSCRKSDEKIEELIIGNWVGRPIVLSWPAHYHYSDQFEFRTNNLLIFNGQCSCGCTRDTNGNYTGASGDSCYTEYKIENGDLKILMCVFHYSLGVVGIDSVSQYWYRIPIKRINKNVMILGGEEGYPEQKFIKQ